MLASTPQPSRDCSISPSYRRRRVTSKPYESPMLTPLRRVDRAPKDELDEFFLQSPFKSSTPYKGKNKMPLSEDRSNSPLDTYMASPLLSSPLLSLPPKPLLTPVKQAAHGNHRHSASPIAPLSVGLKRKSLGLQSTPVRHHVVTPLKLTSPGGGGGFDRLSRPSLTVHTPRSSKEDVDTHLRKQTASMNKMRIADFADSDDDLLALSDIEDKDEAVFLGGELKGGPLSLGLPDHAAAGVKRRKDQPRTSAKRVDRSPSPSPKPLPSRKSIHEGPRRRKSSLHSSRQAPVFKAPVPKQPVFRQGLNRVDSATMFFGPPSMAAAPTVPASSSTPRAWSPSPHALSNRHSFASGSTWNTYQANKHVSPSSSPGREHDGASTDDDMDFEPFAANSSFSFSITGSPGSTSRSDEALPKKYRPRDSGIVLSDDDEWGGSNDAHPPMPGTSNSFNSIFSTDDGLVTPINGPSEKSGWPAPRIAEAVGDTSFNAEDDAMILRTLAQTSRPAPEETKKVPGTPVKKVKTAYMSGRPWQSAVAKKVTSVLDTEVKKGKPRKTMPAAFAAIGRKALDSDSDGEESPSNRKEKYAGLGLGRPSAPTPAPKESFFPRTRWLMRRSSSGALSSGSGSASSRNVTPVRSNKVRGSFMTGQFLSPGRTASGSSTSTSNSPTLARKSVLSGLAKRTSTPKSSLPREHEHDDQPGRFEREFVALDDIGHGEFGKVMKARLKGDEEQSEVFAVKQSKPFEGVKHRLRLQEEVQVLKHISQVNDGRPHANVLRYIDSWEEQESLYIRTELCELGNLARFLWEYGKSNPHLDEARVWKIIADLSNGLQFIHDSGVIHLDLKPSNIFITGEGRFKIGDFGMASFWPKPSNGSSEREGDKLYLAPEILQGNYGMAADIFSFGMTLLETAANIVVPDGGDAWHRLRQDDFCQVGWPSSPQLFELIQSMMRRNPEQRLSATEIWAHPVVARARAVMAEAYTEAIRTNTSTFVSSPLASVREDFLEDILAEQHVADMDISF